MTNSDKAYSYGIFLEIAIAIIIVLSVMVISRGCEINELEEKYQEAKWDAEEAYEDGYRDGYNDGCDDD